MDYKKEKKTTLTFYAKVIRLLSSGLWHSLEVDATDVCFEGKYAKNRKTPGMTQVAVQKHEG